MKEEKKKVRFSVALRKGSMGGSSEGHGKSGLTEELR